MGRPSKATVRIRCFGAGILAAVFLTAPAKAQEAFTIQDVLSAPFPSDLVAHAELPRIAWVQNAEGVRNVWVADGPDWTARRLTSYERDDGQEIGDLTFTADGATVVYVRGGAPNRQGWIPNPALDPEPPERAIWAVPYDGGEPVELSEGSSPTTSPVGSTVAFLRRGQIWTVPADGSADPEQLMTVRGGPGSLRWSPDGSRLAFANSRGDHAFIGVYDFRAKELRYLDPSVDRDGSPVWSPDGLRIAFLRIPWQGEREPFHPEREGHPWSIRVVDVATGRGSEVWRASEGVGSAFQSVSAESQIFWGRGDRLVFPWEGDGWLHLYSVPVSGGEPTPLTPGEFEVQCVEMTPDRRFMLFDSNQDDIDRKHVWRVPVGQGPPEALTSGRGIEWGAVQPGGTDAVALLASGPRYPAHAALLDGGAEPHPIAPETLPERFPLDRLVEPEQVIFPASDGLEIHAQLFLPPEAKRGERHPAVVFFHGGSRRQMLLGWHHRGYYHNAYGMNQYLASRGYVVLAVNYRSGIGYGMRFREALHYGAAGGAEFNDVMGAGLYLAGRPDVDPGRIGVWGGSYGGYLTAMALSRASDLFAAGVDLHGVHDWNHGIQNFVPSYEEVEHPEAARTAYEASPIARVDTWKSPVLLIQGDDDRNVAFSESVHLAEALRPRGVHVEQLVFPDEVHGFLMHRSWLAAYRAAADFFGRMLNGR